MICFLVFFSCNSSKSIVSIDTHRSPWEAKLENEKTRSFNEGESKGFSDGVADGNREGYSRGYEIGFREATLESKERTKEKIDGLTKSLSDKKDSQKCQLLLDEVRNFSYRQGEEVGKNEGHEIGYVKGRDIGYKKGYEEGFEGGLQKNLHQIISRDSEFQSHQFGDFKSSLNYEKILDDINSLSGNKESDSLIFHRIVDDIQREVVLFVIDELELSPIEKEDFMKEYRYKFADLTRNYYADYQHRMSLQIDSGKAHVKYFEEYNKAENLAKVLGTGICGVVSIGLVFARVNPLIGLTNGFICADLLTNVFSSIEDDLLKISIFREYNSKRSELKSESIDLISELAVTEFSRSYRKHKKKAILLSDAEIRLDIMTKVKVGFDLNDFEIEIDHEKMKFSIILPNAPKTLSVSQVPTFLSIDTGFLININSSDLNELFLDAKEETLRALYSNGIDDIARVKADQVLKTLFYPIIAIPKSQYSVEVKFGTENYVLY